MITGLNLSLSNHCSANCVFCPSERGTRDHRHMEPSLVAKLLCEVTDALFPWRVTTVQVGENGDAFLNPDCLKILRMIRSQLPGAKINLGTNLLSVSRETLEAIFAERLLDGLQLNVDGHDAESYQAQKRASYGRLTENLWHLLEVRALHWSGFPVTIHVLPLVEYVAEVRRRFGHDPVKLGGRPVPSSSFEQVRESLSWLPQDVEIRHSPIFCWAERSLNPPVSQLGCPQQDRMAAEAFISPSGLWYPCCMDANQDLAYGSVRDHTLMELHESPGRARFMQQIKERRFEEIGYPCSTSLCCFGYGGFIKGGR